MIQLTIGTKKYVLLREKEYQTLQKRATLKSMPERVLTFDQARLYSKKLINNWAAER